MRIAFVVGDLGTLSGGYNVIIEYASALERLGHEVHVLTKDRCGAPPAWHPRLEALRVRHVAEVGDERFDFAFATWFLTFFELFRVRSRVYGYLSQSLESRFHPEAHLKVLARCTYSLPLLMVTEARWLAEFIRTVQPAARTLYVRNGLSREYFPRVEVPPERQGSLRVLVEGPWAVPFKGVPETFEVLREARARGLRFDVGWLSSDAGGARPSLGGTRVEIHERVPIDRVRNVLGRYDVLLKLSRVEGMYGPPLEMFSQGGTAITYTVTGSDEYMVHGHNGLLVEPYNRREIVRYLELLDRRRPYLAALRRNALATARLYPDWEASGAELAGALEGIAAEGWTNAGVRPALAALSTLENRWQDDVRRLGLLNGPVARLVDGLDRLKTSRFAKRVLPPSMRSRVHAYLHRVLR
jgi:glycosyltransferase involved in cell wall biosynthesis